MSTTKWTRAIAPGITMPMLAFGTYRLRGETCRDAVRDALRCGFQHVDTASVYGNERDVGEALRACHREVSERIFVTTKIAPSEMRSEEEAAAAIAGVNERLGRTPDLVLVHWPGRDKESPDSERHRDARRWTWRALENALKMGQCRAIGVSNYELSHLRELLQFCDVKPAVNQIELHARFPQTELRAFCESVGVHVVGYSPLGVGALLDDDRVKAYAATIGLRPAPALVRWTLSMGASVVVKSSVAERTEENFTAISDLDDDFVHEAAEKLETAFASERVKFCWNPSSVR